MRLQGKVLLGDPADEAGGVKRVHAGSFPLGCFVRVTRSPSSSTSQQGAQTRGALTFSRYSAALCTTISETFTGQATNRVASSLNARAICGCGEKCNPPPHSTSPPSQSGAFGIVPGA